MISHHPTEQTLQAYAAGTLPEALAMVIATHLSQCELCQRSLSTLETIGGALLAELAPVPLETDALDLLLGRMDDPLPAVPPVLNPELPAPLDRIALGRWWPIGLGVRYRPLQVAGSAWGGLILAQPGRGLPKHSHKGLELTCILSGSFIDGMGEFRAGDLSEPGTHHDQPPRVLGTEPCLCIIASEGMLLRGLLGLGQRVIG